MKFKELARHLNPPRPPSAAHWVAAVISARECGEQAACQFDCEPNQEARLIDIVRADAVGIVCSLATDNLGRAHYLAAAVAATRRGPAAESGPRVGRDLSAPVCEGAPPEAALQPIPLSAAQTLGDMVPTLASGEPLEHPHVLQRPRLWPGASVGPPASRRRAGYGVAAHGSATYLILRCRGARHRVHQHVPRGARVWRDAAYIAGPGKCERLCLHSNDRVSDDVDRVQLQYAVTRFKWPAQLRPGRVERLIANAPVARSGVAKGVLLRSDAARIHLCDEGTER